MASFAHPTLIQQPAHHFPRGARPSPRHALAAAAPHRVLRAAPPQCAYVPKQLDYWGNDRYGDCVTAEEAFAKACYGLDGQGNALAPEIFIPTSTVTGWASRNGYLNGADLSSVIESMERSGFAVLVPPPGPKQQLYNDGAYSSVDYSSETVLQSAIAQGPVKIAIAAGVLPNGAGSQQGWYITGNQGGRNTDHCVSLAGYGPAGWLYQQLGVALPSALQATQAGYLLFTWSTIGFVDHAWIMGTCAEAWVRNPTTLGVPPLPPIVPPAPPAPPVASLNVPAGVTIPQGEYAIGDAGNPTAMVWLQGSVPPGSYPVNVPSPPALKL